MKIKAFGLAAILGLGFSGCVSMSSTADGKTLVFSGQQSCPALLEMDSGQTLQVVLNENPSTGYAWSLAENPLLFKVEETYQSDRQPSDVPIVGAGGKKTYRFTALQAGEAVLHLKHARAWEKPPIDEWVCRVRIS